MKNNISEQNKSTIDDISYMEITSNVPYNTHSQVEIFYVVKGNVSITVNGATKTLHKNQICFCDRFVSHSYNLLDSSTKCIVLVVPDYYTSKLDAWKMRKKFSNNYILDERLAVKLKLFLELLAGIERVNENIIPRSLYSEGLVTTILGLILKNLPLVDNTNKNAKIISSIIQYVNDHYAEKLTLDDVAKHFGYSKYYFSKLFNKNFICHFSDYVNHVRCRAIITILNSIPNQTILTTIMNSGFSSPSAFYKFFKDHYNISPSKIKKLEFSDEIINFDLSSLLKN